MPSLRIPSVAETDNSFHLMFHKKVKSLHLAFLATTKQQMEVAMKQKAILAALCVFFCLLANAFPGDAIGSDKIKEMLLRPGGWLVEWRGSGSGVIDFIFEDRGEKLVVKINNAAWNQACERDVTITSDLVKFDGCNAKDISLVYDPGDREYPFKGESSCCYYKLKAK